MDTAIPCGLIINELITNALKYAFPDNREGEIKIAIYKSKDHMHELHVSDNGIGIPEEIDYKHTKSMGLHVVNTLSRQLSAKIELLRSVGTDFRISFKVN